MRNFSVKEIAQMLGTNPETVRRWIRDGKLESSIISRKDGNVVSEIALKEFLRKTPKYAGIATVSLASGTLPLVGAIAGVSVVALSSIISKAILDEKKEDQVSLKSLEKYINSSIKDYKESISEKQEQIHALEKTVQDEQRQISDLLKILDNIRAKE